MVYQIEDGLEDDMTPEKRLNKRHNQSEDVKDILKIIDQSPILDEEQIELAKFISEYYISSLGQAIFKMIPSGQRERLFASGATEDIIQAGQLLPEQKQIVDRIENAVNQKENPAVHLIFGITGSGKTRIYIELINISLKKNIGAILLLPEIALTYQFLQVLKPYYGDQMVMLHSNLSKSERLEGYRRLQRGEAILAVGTRSIVFAPVKNLGLIIIDEEHDQSYKEAKPPKYQTKTVAWYRLKNKPKDPLLAKGGAQKKLILGSATPSTESYQKAVQGTFHLHYLHQRATGLDLPKIYLVQHNIFSSRITIFSKFLLRKITEHLANDKQILLLLNRRGYSNFVFCETCKKSTPCENCSVTLTHHQSDISSKRKKNKKSKAHDEAGHNKYLKCHLCGYQIDFHPECSVCGTPLTLMGKGVQKVEDAIETHFPKVVYARLDQDSTQVKGYTSDILRALQENQIKILIGTQMVAKGFDLPNITLVGVINADIGLNLPDFRAVERVSQLLIQAAGRAGRHAAGEVVMQTMQNESMVMQTVANYQYEDFLKQELLLRKHSGFPPYDRLLRILLKSADESNLKSYCQKLENFLKFHFAQENLFDENPNKVEVNSIFGPMPASIEKINNEYRYQLVLKDKRSKNLQEAAHLLKKHIQGSSRSSGVKYEFDMDPNDLL